jgi:eukaryotic-like serine/threonine-protein kinase
VDRVLKLLARTPVGPVVAVVTVAGLWLLSGTPAAAHRVPDLEGLQVNPAIARAAEEGYFTKVVFRRVGGIAGTVINQSPEARVVRNKGTRILLEVTKGAAQVKVPDVRGVVVEEARRQLDRGHVTPGAVTYTEHAGTASNHVIKTDPPAGKLVDVETTVDIVAAA